jgi:AraC family transcriptional regulator
MLSPGAYFGNRKRMRRLRDLVLVENAYPPGFSIPRHAHASAFLGLAIEGHYRETYDRRTRDCGPAALVFHPAGEVHSELHGDVVVRIFSIEPSEQLLGVVREHARRLDEPREFRGGPLLRLATRMYRELSCDEPLAGLAIEGLALELLAYLGRAGAGRSRAAPAWLRRAHELLHDRFREDLPLAEVAEVAGVHPAHLSRAFRQSYGCTVGDYLRQLRIERACVELQATERPLAEIASALGYSDQSHFTTAFRRQTGVTPRAFRMQRRRKMQRGSKTTRVPAISS